MAEIRLNKLIKQFNIGLDTLVDFLNSKGAGIENANPNMKVSDEYLEELHKKYEKCGLVVIGFPSGDFANQELADGTKAEEFCQLNYGVSFTIMKKVHVNGEEADPIFKYLKSQTKGFLGSRIKWNFTKFLISKDGKEIKRYAPTTRPEKIRKDIEAFL